MIINSEDKGLILTMDNSTAVTIKVWDFSMIVFMAEVAGMAPETAKAFDVALKNGSAESYQYGIVRLYDGKVHKASSAFAHFFLSPLRVKKEMLR